MFMAFCVLLDSSVYSLRSNQRVRSQGRPDITIAPLHGNTKARGYIFELKRDQKGPPSKSEAERALCQILLNAYFDDDSRFYANGGTYVLVGMAWAGIQCETCCCELTNTEAGILITPLNNDGEESSDHWVIAEQEHVWLRNLLKGRFTQQGTRIPDEQPRRPVQDMLKDFDLQANIIRTIFGPSSTIQ